MKNKIVRVENDYTLITGASGGLGRAFVKELAAKHENLVLTGTSEKKLIALKEEFKDVFNDIKVETFVLNLASVSERENLIKFLKEKNISIVKLINNAGVIIEGDLLRFEDSEIINAVEVNCVGTLDLTQKLLKVRDKSKKFEVLTVASVAASYPIPHMAVYAATKSFLVSIMTGISEELKNENVVITTLCPGGMATTDAMKESLASMGLGGRLSCLDTRKVAKIGLCALEKGKKVVVAGKFNKFLTAISAPFTTSFLAKRTGKIWKKSQDKRNF